MLIDVEKAKKIEISVNEEKRSVRTTENVVKNILAEANIDVTEDDKLSHSLHQKVGEDGKIDVEQAFDITIVDGGKPRQVSATSTTIANVLLKNPHLKVIAVDPKVIPLGSDVWVEGYGYAVAGDTGGAIKGNIIDLFMPNIDDAYK